MLKLKCPICKATGDESDFNYGGQAHIIRPASKNPDAVTLQEHYDYLYVKKNPKGLHEEMWHCERGCGKWFIAVRDTVDLRITEYKKFASELATEAPIKKPSPKNRLPQKKTPKKASKEKSKGKLVKSNQIKSNK